MGQADNQTSTAQPKKKRRITPYVGPEPSVEEIEAEFWRIVETPDDVYESLYGQVHALPFHTPIRKIQRVTAS